MRKARVLIADDNKGIRDVLNGTLANDFDVIRAVNDGRSALSAATRLIPDVAILDISTPGLNGIEVARRIRDKGLQITVVFLTCCTDREIFDAACEVGVLRHVIKWRLQTDLVPAINLALSGMHFISPGRG